MHYEKINIFPMRDYIFSEWELPDEFLYKNISNKNKCDPETKTTTYYQSLKTISKTFLAKYQA
jgi:hypothetical protein